jgi:hypothetical protein
VDISALAGFALLSEIHRLTVASQNQGIIQDQLKDKRDNGSFATRNNNSVCLY